MLKSHEDELKLEIKHIFESGANEIRIFEMVKNFIDSKIKAYSYNIKSDYLFEDILSFLTINDVEDGHHHDSEEPLIILINNDVGYLLDKLDFLNTSDEFNSLSNIILLLSNIRTNEHYGIALRIEKFINHKSLRVRDASVRFFDNYGSRAFIPVLESYEEKISWLSEYKQRVIESLKNRNKF
jgi:hypothetical protein